MPWFEKVRPRPVRDRLAAMAGWSRRLTRRPAARVRALLLLPAALTAMMCATMFAAGFPGSGRSDHSPRVNTVRELVVRNGCWLNLLRVAPNPC